MKKKKHWMSVTGWLEMTEGLSLSSLAKGKDCLEIGGYKGRSTTAMASGAKSVLTIDTFKADDGGQNQGDSFTTLDEFLDNIQGYSNIEHIVGRSQDVLPTLTNRVFDFVFIDGWHSHTQVYNEIIMCWDLIKDDGVFAFHDANLAGIRDAILRVFEPPKLTGMQSLVWVNKEYGAIQ